jgi:glycogen synthase
MAGRVIGAAQESHDRAGRVAAPAGGSPSRLRLALCSWEIGRAGTGLGVKIGGLGHVMEELPAELIRAAAGLGLELEVELLSPCFGHYPRERLTRLPRRVPAVAEGSRLEFEVYEHRFPEEIRFPDGSVRSVPIRAVYLWNERMLSWTDARAVYPGAASRGLSLYAAVSQAMAGYIEHAGFQTVHLHDYHVGLIPFFLPEELAREVPIHLTIHNASYQGVAPAPQGGPAELQRIGLPGARLFERYFDFFGSVNPMRACMLRLHELGGRVTTVSGDLAGTWGYAAECRETHEALRRRATAQLGRPPIDLYLPNQHLDVFERIPIAGITNGLGERSRAASMPELTAAVLREAKARRGGAPLFRDGRVEEEMLRRDHTFDVGRLETKQELRRLLGLEVFGEDLPGDLPLHQGPVTFSAIGRLVLQKNFGLIADVIPRVLAADGQARFVIIAKAEVGDAEGLGQEARFRALAARHPGRVSFHDAFDPLLARLATAGSDFALIPSRFEPCGLTDWEAALLGTLPICHATGGLTKIRHCGFLYDWLDIGDWWGEVDAFFGAIGRALEVFRHDPAEYLRRVRAGMETDTRWDTSARQYVELYLAALRPPPPG